MKKKTTKHCQIPHDRLLRKRTHSNEEEHEVVEHSPSKKDDSRVVKSEKDSTVENLQNADNCIEPASTESTTAKDPDGQYEKQESRMSWKDDCLDLSVASSRSEHNSPQSLNSPLSGVSGVKNTACRPHDLNNNSMHLKESYRQDKSIVAPEAMIVDESSRHGNGNYGNQSTSTSTMTAKDAGDDSYLVQEDSRYSNDGDRIISINLYGTDTDPVYQDHEGHATPNNHPEGSVDRQHVHSHQYHQHAAVPECTDQRSTQQYVFPEESNMSVSNQGSSDTHNYGRDKMTNFEGIFRMANTGLPENGPGERGSNMVLPEQSTPPVSYALTKETSHHAYRQTISYSQAHISNVTTPNSLEDCNIAHEKLTSELVGRYGNSQMIQDMLKQTAGEHFVCEGFEQRSQEEFSPYTGHSQPLLKDIGILNTPKQIDNMYYNRATVGKPVSFSSPEAFSTPEREVMDSLNPQQNIRGAYTYNDVQLHGVKWSALNESSENPCPHPSPLSQGVQQCFSDIGVLNSPLGVERGMNYQKEVGQKMRETCMPHQALKTHVSQEDYEHKPNPSIIGQQMPRPENHHPRREVFERINEVEHRQHYPEYQYRVPWKKRHKQLRYINVPAESPTRPGAQMNNMMSKCKPEYHPGHHVSAPQPDYFVANPSDTTSMSPRALLCRYIDFLLLENEQITEISKSVTPSFDVRVIENMTLMESLKYSFPFPSKKFVKWVNFFFPKLNFWAMDFKGRKPSAYLEHFTKKVDNRPTMDLLRDAFFFFQRENDDRLH